MRRLLAAAALALGLSLPAAAGPAASPWPMARRDSQKSSSATFNGAAPVGSLFNKVQRAWSVTLPNSGYMGAIGDSVSLDANENAYVTSGDAVFALTKSTGGIIWVSTLPGTNFSQPAISEEGQVYTSSSNAVIAFSSMTGQHLWTYRPVGKTVTDLAGGSSTVQIFEGDGHPVIDPLGRVLVSAYGENGSASGQRRALVAVTSTGTLAWGITKGGGFNSSVHPPAVSSVSGSYSVFFKTSDSGSLYQRAAADGSATNAYSDGFSDGDAAKMSVFPNGEVIHYKNATGRKLERLDSSLVSLWVTTQTLTNRVWTPALDGDSKVYATADGRLYGFDASNGNVILNLYMDVDDVYSLGPPTVVSSDTVMFTGQRNFHTHLYNVDTVNKVLRWRLPLAPNVSSNLGQVSVSTHAIYVHTMGGGTHMVHAFSRGTYSSISISSTPQTRSGNFLYSTVTVRALDGAGNPVVGVPIRNDGVTASLGVSVSVSALQAEDQLSFSTTNALGEAYYRVAWDFSSSGWNLSYSPVVASTITFTPLGMTASSMLLQNLTASTFTVTVSSPAILGADNAFLQMSTMTFTVATSTGGLAPNTPVALKIVSVNGGSPKGTLALPGASLPVFASQEIRGFTDAASQFVAHYYAGTSQFIDSSYKFSAEQLPALDVKIDAYALGVATTAVQGADARPSTFTVAFSSPAIQTDIGHSTLTVTVYDAFGATVPAALVSLKGLSSSGRSGYSFRSYMADGTCLASEIAGYTDAFGVARFLVDNRNCPSYQFDNFTDYLSSAPVHVSRLPVSTKTVLVEGNYLEGYAVTAPTTTSVGVAFRSTVTAVNLYGHALPRYNEAGVTLSPLFDGTAVQGTGSLGTSVISFAASPGSVVVSSQTYNKIENIQIKATRGSGSIKTGVSNSIVIQGPAAFTMEIPTGTAAGAVFTGTITAVDAGGTPIVGYGATLSITPVLAASTATPGGGSLSPATVNLPANGKVVVNNLTYSKGEGIRIRVFDSSLNIQGYSSSITVTAPALTISHYSITAPTQVSVGVPFNFQVNALNASSAPVSYSLSRNITVQAFLNGTSFAGSGSLGAAAMTLQSGSTYSFTASQTYNKIETVQLRVTDEDGRTGLSGPIVFTGPTQFEVTIPTAAQAGVNFQVVVVARDASNNQVLGYNGTVSLAAVQAADTALSGGGVLGATSLNIAAGLGSTSFQTYTKAEGIRLRVSDSGIGVTSFSSSATVRAGPASALALTANPQSTISGVPSVLTATAQDQYSNAVQGATVTFSVVSGSGVVSLSLVNGAVSSAVTSTQAVTDSSGQTSAFFGSTNSVSAQANLLRATIGALAKDTTVYNAVLITSAGGTVVNLGDPRLRAEIPANTWGYSVRMSVQGRAEMSSTEVAQATAAFASQPNTFVSTTVMRVSAVRDSSPSSLAGAGSRLVSVSLPYQAVGSSVTVGSYRGQSVLVPLSVLRVFKLNSVTSSFEMVLDGSNAVNTASGVVTAQVSNPEGVFALGAPAFATLSSTQTTTVTATIASGATAQVVVPAGAFPAGTTLSVGVPSTESVPTPPSALGATVIGTPISVTAGGTQPSSPVTVRVGYRPSDVAGLVVENLRLARYDESTGWTILDSQVDAGNRVVVGTTDHFSLFMIVSVSPGSSVSQGFVYPNPFRPALGHTRLKLAGLPPGAKVRIFTATGRLLKELEADSVGQILTWDGTDRDGRALASGVYLAVLDGSGGRRTIKFAVQR